MMALGFVSFLTNPGCRGGGLCRSALPTSAERGRSWHAGVGKSQARVNGSRGLGTELAGLFITGCWVTVTDGLGPGLALYQCKNHTSQGAE